ncbi:hypothetical protein SKAU_G00260960 [Synaphobranchus kaupii]|uniref:ATP synthase peripheral stalk subunit F6, mitochondrial n=1 Tax=Synaphobranchus kaupii TaxID=118154 RepID=A0A9Q1F4Y1_SYNKA|nr:hypothetical protein SKAU_G00260960 [Synaphobranchus kaupii]
MKWEFMAVELMRLFQSFNLISQSITLVRYVQSKDLTKVRLSGMYLVATPLPTMQHSPVGHIGTTIPARLTSVNSKVTLCLCTQVFHIGMALHRLFRLSSLLRSAVVLTLRRNDLDPIQKLFLDKIQDYSRRSKASGGMVDAGPDYQKNLSEEMTKLQRLYGGGDLIKFPTFKFPEPKLDDVVPK